MTDNEMTDPDSGPTSSGQTTSMAPPLGPPQPASRRTGSVPTRHAVLDQNR
jgi:hypothetical protein